MTARRVAALTLTTCALVFPARADSEDIALDYLVPAGCPERALFIEEVRALTSKATFVADPGAGRHFRVSAVVRAKSVSGTLVIEAGDERSEREVSGSTCSEVVSALALATAIAVDPAILGAEPEPQPKPDPEPLPETPEPEPTARSRPQDPPERERRRTGLPPPAPSPPQSRIVFALGMGVMTAIAPDPASRPLLRVGYKPAPRMAPELFLEGARVLPVDGDSSSFAAWLARAGATWEFLEFGAGTFGILLASEVGSLTASGTDALTGPRTEERLWSAVEGGFSLTLASSSPLFLRLEAGGFLTLQRHEYSVASAANELRTVHAIPLSGVRASALAGFFL